MATYYVRKTGSDSNNGTNPTTQAWATIGKALGTTGIASGDTVYIGAGTYRETVTVTMVAPTAETKIIGDTDGSQTGDAGQVLMTAYTTNDTTAPAAGPTLALNQRPFMTIQNISFVAGSGARAITGSGGGTFNHDIKLTNCSFMTSIGAGSTELVGFNIAGGGPGNITIDSCMFFNLSGGPAINISPATNATDYNCNTLIKNCLFVGGSTHGIRVVGAGAAGFGGGVTIYNCSFISTTAMLTTTLTPTSIPCNIYNCFGACMGTAFNAAVAGQIVEDFNVVTAATLRSNVSVGANSKDNTYALRFSFGQERIWGEMPRIFATPLPGSPILGVGAQAGGPTVDITGANRPAGGSSTSYAAGCFELGNTGAQETSTVRSGSNSLRITGPGYHDFYIPVDATPTTVKVYAQYDTNHAATNKPQLSLLANGEIGVSAVTATMTAAANTWEQISTGSFTPTKKGVVTVRLISRSAAGNGNAYFDDFSVG